MTSLQSVEQRARHFLAELCSTYTPAGSESRLLPLLLPELERLGARVRICELGGGAVNVLALWGEPRILYSTHLDVVPPELPIRFEEDRLVARGACDAKGQIAAQLAAIEILLGSGRKDLAWLGLSGEESDSSGAQASLSLARELSACVAIVVGEPTDCALAAGQKGFVRMRLSCRGKTAHGGMPELGRNAIMSLIDWIHAIDSALPGEDPVLGREAWNLGLIDGGRAANVVPDAAGAELCLRTVPGGRLRAAVEDSRPECGSVEILVEEPHAFFDKVGGFACRPVPFGSDLPLMRGISPGAKAVLAGPGSAALAHTDHESLGYAELRDGIELFRRLAPSLGGD